MEKRPREALGSGNARGESRWAELTPELLALIFTLMPADVLARTMSFVCRSWRDVLAEPYSWSVVDLANWCLRVERTDVIDLVVRRLVDRSRGTVRRLSVYYLGDSGFAHTALLCRLLSKLEMRESFVTDKMVKEHANLLSNLTFLDISYCANITSEGIEALGKNCKNLVLLRRSMPPPGITPENGLPSMVDEGEAMAIANNMVGLKQLELSYGKFTNNGLVAILTNCTALIYLDIVGCRNVQMTGNIELMCRKIKTCVYTGYKKDISSDDFSTDSPTDVSSDQEDEA
ncbi:F-box protein FBW2-like [Zingiber officinale]|uniref:F-box protein FBW2-like n=1 Tax=Zingiber officinale TaxID=94328 RepID=UPI001C4CD7ED|nr:F-box protein FBW2-like [Zingiber officinale]